MNIYVYITNMTYEYLFFNRFLTPRMRVITLQDLIFAISQSRYLMPSVLRTKTRKPTSSRGEVTELAFHLSFLSCPSLRSKGVSI